MDPTILFNGIILITETLSPNIHLWILHYLLRSCHWRKLFLTNHSMQAYRILYSFTETTLELLHFYFIFFFSTFFLPLGMYWTYFFYSFSLIYLSVILNVLMSSHPLSSLFQFIPSSFYYGTYFAWFLVHLSLTTRI